MFSFAQLLLTLVPIILLVFWFWMFKDMTDDEDVPPCFITVTNGRNVKPDWAIMFVVLNIVTAGIYYYFVYRNRK